MLKELKKKLLRCSHQSQFWNSAS